MRIDGNVANIFNQKENKQENEKLNNKQSSSKNFDDKLDSFLSDSFSLDFDQFKNNDITNGKMLHASEETLEDNDKFTKNLLDNLINQFFGNDKDITMFPKALQDSNSNTEQNPYSINSSVTNQSSIIVGSQQEYYEKQTLEFSASLTIETPNSTFEMEISISITQELYVSNDFGFDDSKFLDPITLNHDKDENPFGDTDSLHFIFDQNQDEKDDRIGNISKLLEFFNNYDKEQEQKENNSLINIYQEKFEGSYEFTSIVDTNQGSAVYLSSFEMNYSYESTNYQSSNSNDNNSLDISI